jgi:hypothetical protein
MRPEVNFGICWPVAAYTWTRLAWNVVGCLNPGGNGCGLSAIAGVASAKATAQIAGISISFARNMMALLDIAARRMRAFADSLRHLPGRFMVW